MRDSQILPQKTMLEIVQTLPDTAKALKAVKGMGGTRMKQFGREILSILLEYRRTNGLELPGDALHEVERAGFDSRHQTLELFRSGMSIPEIARSRQLANSTIEQHLLYGLSEGVIPIGRLLSEDRLQEIQDCMEHHKARSVSALRTYLGEHFSYAEIRFALKYFEKG
ncbi:MAG: helix-turn-helix domain-containing protein [Marinilabiliales bacterium]|nr:helix-turn-helix domain-containing protein [Marinilabiliales bacterium]